MSTRPESRPALDIFAVTIFISAGLLFLVQPLFARMVLPLLGGSPAVWNTALVFYQAVLLAGYAYAHFICTRVKLRQAAALHLVVLAVPLFLLPMAVPRGWVPPTDSNPIPWLLWLLLITVGPAFFAVSATSPILQRWFAAGGRRGSGDPYFLYAASNAGSMLALLSYPFLIEPALRLQQQGRLWQAGYFVFFALMAGCAAVVWRRGDAAPGPLQPAAAENDVIAVADKPALRRRLRWMLLAMVPSSLMMGVTTYLSNEIAAIPLLWIVPLVLYLLSFICVFAARPPFSHKLAVRLFALLAVPLTIALAVRASEPLWLLVPLHLLALFAAALMCHGEIAHDRPAPAYLTEFYLWMSFGGVLGGIFNALIAPSIFSSVLEYPIMIVVACLLMPRALLIDNIPRPSSRKDRVLDFALPLLLLLVAIPLVTGMQHAPHYAYWNGWGRFLREHGLLKGPGALAIMFGPTTIVAFTWSRRPLRYALALAAVLYSGTWFHLQEEGTVLYTARSFFGVHRVTLDPSGNYVQLVHGNTLHGMQCRLPGRGREALAYYYRTGPIGQVFQTFGPRWRDVGVVGLGVGSLAAYATPAQHWTYFEIDPVVYKIASDPQYFTFLRDCRAPLLVTMGDARLSLTHVADNSLDVLVLDAYSSDAIPIHLLTRQAMSLYVHKIRQGGLLAFHISNRHLNLKPVLAELAYDAHLTCLLRSDDATRAEMRLGKSSSEWAVVARSPADFGPLSHDKRWVRLRRKPGSRLWTDDYSSILDVMTWK